MWSKRVRFGVLSGATLLTVAVASLFAQDERQSVLHDGFESPQPVWQREQADTTVQLRAHDRSIRARYEGRLSERFAFEAGLGSAFYYSYALPRIPVTDAVRASLFVRSNRAGVQLFGRVVLPGDIDPETKAPSFVLVPGTVYESSDRWQRLELSHLRPSIERQARVIRAATKRPVSLQGAYLDHLVVNLFGGEGPTEVFLDELVVSPVSARLLAAMQRPEQEKKGPRATEAEGMPRPEHREQPPVQLLRYRLTRTGKDGPHDWIPTVIDAPGADLRNLREAGFDVLYLDPDSDPQRASEAVRRGFLLLPNLATLIEGDPSQTERVVAAAGAYPFRDSVAFWNVGEHLGRDRDPLNRSKELDRTRALVSGLRGLKGEFSKLTTAMVEGEFPLYARAPLNIDMLGIRPHVWGSTWELTDTYHYLMQRNNLTVSSNADQVFLGWIPATPPQAVQTAIWGHDVPPSWGTPRIQPDQIRLFTYAVLAAGYRGIGFEASSDLTRGLGRMLLYEMALLNAEIDLFESIFARRTDAIAFYKTYRPEPKVLTPLSSQGQGLPKVVKKPEAPPHESIRAASIGIGDRKGFLLLVADYAAQAQYQPPQMALNDLKVTVPVPDDAQAFEVSPGGFSVLKRERVPGGVQLTIPDFGTTALVLVTTELSLAADVEKAIRGIRPRAIQLAIEQAQIELAWVREINGRLLADGHHLVDPNLDPDDPDPSMAAVKPAVPEETAFLNQAEEFLKSAREALEREDYTAAWTEARRVSRPLRLLMRSHWEQAFKALTETSTPPRAKNSRQSKKLINSLRFAHNRNHIKSLDDLNLDAPVLVSPVSSPPLVAFNTLPQHYVWVDWMKNGRFGNNLVPSGDFESRGTLESAGWIDVSHPVDGVQRKIANIPGGRDGSKRLLRLKVTPADPQRLDDFPFFDHPVAAVRSPALRVEAGQFLRYSVLVQKPLPSNPGAGGVVIRDSIGGEPLEFRSSEPLLELTRLVIYRRVPVDGLFTVTLGLAGIGHVDFDDFRIERVETFPTIVDSASSLPPRRRPPPPPPAPATAVRPRLREAPR